MTIAYFDAFSGISGDMSVGALLDLGCPWDALVDEVRKLPLAGYRLEREQRVVHGIRAVRFSVRVDGGEQTERTLHDIVRMLEESALAPAAAERAGRVFRALAEAEARVHGVAVDDVHFHEVGAVDSIVDIVATAAALWMLGVDEIYASALPLGKGLVGSRHGTLPVPAPATVELVRGLAVRMEDGDAEMVTPTGAAILAGLCAPRGQGPPEMRIQSVGYGAGERELVDRPNLLRVILGEKTAPLGRETLVVMETNIDDLNPQLYEHVTERLLAAGARDVFLAPIQMKKGRPGVLLWVLAEEHTRERLGDVIFRETSTLGVRYYPVSRVALRREAREVATAYGRVRVKVAFGPDGRERAAPEYEDCRRLALEKGVPLLTVYEETLRACLSRRA